MKEYFRPSLSKESIKSTIEAWQPLSKDPLTEQDAIEILTNMFGFLNAIANTEEGQKIMNETESQQNHLGGTEDMAKFTCVLCGKGAEAPLDEHVETHHNKYDVNRILLAVVESMKQLNEGKELPAIQKAQSENKKRLKERGLSLLQ